MLPIILAYSVLLLYLLNALGLYEWWNSMLGSSSSIVVKIIPGFGFFMWIDRQQNMSSSVQGDYANGVSMS